MIKVYPAIIHEEDGYWVEFPDLIGCNSFGETLEETIDNAQEALGLYLINLVESRQSFPVATEISKITPADSATVSYIYTDVDKYRRNNKSVKKTVSLPAWLADAAEANYLSLSKILQDGIKAKLGLV
ncbi:MAG: hypothetical protein E7225_08160 [Clostridiales bacterium]|nr:hypothetical protein [Clostridiales bacterium]